MCPHVSSDKLFDHWKILCKFPNMVQFLVKLENNTDTARVSGCQWSATHWTFTEPKSGWNMRYHEILLFVVNQSPSKSQCCYTVCTLPNLSNLKCNHSKLPCHSNWSYSDTLKTTALNALPYIVFQHIMHTGLCMKFMFCWPYILLQSL